MAAEHNEPQDETPDDIAERVVADRQWPAVVTLSFPVEFGGERIAALEFRRGRMGDLRGLKLDNSPPIDHLILLASRMSGKPVKVIESLVDEDAAEVFAIVLGFFARSLGAGKKRSP